jgi:hypothetical protein
MVSRLTWGVAIGSAAVAAGLGIAVALHRHTTSSPPPPPTCTSLQIPCPGVCCPLGDVCPPCPSGYIPDPSFPGCCTSACPPSCTADSDCTPCGSGFVCESGSCTKQIPSVLSLSNLAPVVPEAFTYTQTGCFVIGCVSCNKCNGSWSGGQTFTIATVVDSSGRAVPGVALDFSINGSGWSVQAISEGVTYNTGPVNTDSNGQVKFVITGNQPVDDQGDSGSSNYPCTVCSEGCKTITGTLAGTYGPLTITAVDFPLLQQTAIVATSLDYEGVCTEVGGCPCL